jgi:8-oxo-dGTP pyrophosphatase MutT (NUDIX family)
VSLHDDVVSTLTCWEPVEENQRAVQQAMLAFLAARDDACLRSCAPGHITASALVLDATGDKVLLTLHPRVSRWVQLGGHCEDMDATLRDAALREAVEESGIPGLRIEPRPLHLDVHQASCSGTPDGTRHLDVRYLVRAPFGAKPIRGPESIDLQWWPVDNLPSNVDTLPTLVRLATTRQS